MTNFHNVMRAKGYVAHGYDDELNSNWLSKNWHLPE
jgi:hypothetical protein